MKNCPQCGAAMEDQQPFCSNCGTKYIDPPAADIAFGPVENGGPSMSGFCTRCGKQVDPNRDFCPNCGAELRIRSTSGPVPLSGPPVEPEKPKKKFRTGAIIAAGAAVIVLAGVAFALFATGVIGSPAKKFVAYQEKAVLEPLLDMASAVAEDYNRFGEFSTDMTLTADVNNDSVRPFLKDSSVGLQLNGKKNAFVLSTDLTMAGSQVLNGTLTYDSGKIGFYLPQADENYYVGDLSAIAEKLGAEGFEDISQAEYPQISAEKLAKVAMPYGEIVLSAVTKDNVTKSSRETIRLEQLGGSVEGDLYVYRPTAADLEPMLVKLADHLEQDAELRELVTEYLGSNAKLVERQADMNIEKEFDTALKEAARDLRDNAGEYAENIESANFTWTLGVCKDKVVLDKIELKDASELEISLQLGEGSSAVYLRADDPGGSTAVMEMISRETDGLTDGHCAFNLDSDELLRLEYTGMDLKTKSALGIPHGEYVITVPTPDSNGGAAGRQDIRLTVSAGKSGGTDHTVLLKDMDIPGMGYTDVSVTLNTTDEASRARIPSAPAVDISGYDYDDLGSLFSDMGSELQVHLNEVGEDIRRSVSGGADAPSDVKHPVSDGADTPSDAKHPVSGSAGAPSDVKDPVSSSASSVVVPTGGDPCAAFTDINREAWYHEAVDYVLENGLMSGADGDKFAPDANVTRAVVAQILYNRAGKPAVTVDNPFTDVDGKRWYANAIVWAANEGYIGGYGDGTFAPDADITCEQFAIILWRYAGKPESAKSLDAFKDKEKIHDYGMAAIKWAVEKGIMSGTKDGILAPDRYARRAQVAQMLMNYSTADGDDLPNPSEGGLGDLTDPLTAYGTWKGTLEITNVEGSAPLKGTYEAIGYAGYTDGQPYFEVYINGQDTAFLSYWAESAHTTNTIKPVIGEDDAWIWDYGITEADVRYVTAVITGEGKLSLSCAYEDPNGAFTCDIYINLTKDVNAPDPDA